MSRLSSLRCLAFGTGLILFPALLSGQTNALLKTKDGLALAIAPNGFVASLRLDQREVPLSRVPAMFWIRDAAAKSRLLPIKCSVQTGPDALRVISVDKPLGVEITARIVSRGDFLQVDGEVVEHSGRARCLDLKISLPITTNGFAFGTGLSGTSGTKASGQKPKKNLPADSEVDESIPDENAWYPIAPISNQDLKAGLSLAVPPTHPTRSLTGADDSGPFILLRLGLSPAAATPGRTPFRIILYRHDPAWGFRSALARYYEFYQSQFFTRRVQRIGAWTTQNASYLRHPELYAFHEAGFTTWHHPKGTGPGVNTKPSLENVDQGPACTSLAEYEKLCELSVDQKYGIYSLPYTIVGQRQIMQLPELPRNRDEAMKILDSFATTRPILFDGPPPAGSFRTGEELKAIVRNSGIHDPTHELEWLARPYRGPTLTFPQNPSPRLFADGNKPTVAKYTLDYYLPMMFKSTNVDGCYLDSLGRWCSYYNFRTEHFGAASLPLTYSGEPPQPCLWNLQSHAEYLWELGARLHAQGKIFFANGVHADRVMLGFACDAMGGEGTPVYTGGEAFYALRVAAGMKPYCLLNASHKSTPRLWNSCLYMGYLVGCNAENGWKDEQKYLPLITKLNQAGWHPITHARATSPAVGVERWGGQDAHAPLFFTVMNRSEKAVETELTVDLHSLRRATNQTVLGFPEGVKLDEGLRNGALLLHLKLAAEQAAALSVEPAAD
jgi:hypothetical protein